MDAGGISNTILLIQGGGYLAVFLLMLIEGPIITLAASFLASQGFFNIYIIFLISFLGCFVPDMIFYFLGRLGVNNFVEKYGYYFGLKKLFIKKACSHFHNHAAKAIVFFKLMPFTGIPGVFAAGVSKVRVYRFFIVDFSFNFISALVFTSSGYYSGLVFGRFAYYFGWILPGIAFLIILIWAIPVLYRKLTGKLSKKIERSLKK